MDWIYCQSCGIVTGGDTRCASCESGDDPGPDPYPPCCAECGFPVDDNGVCMNTLPGRCSTKEVA